MSISKDDVIQLGQNIERSIIKLDLKGTDETVTRTLTILRREFVRFIAGKA